MALSQEWMLLQRKIFSRWCSKQIAKRSEVVIKDIVADIKDGVVLVALLEELSGSKCPLTEVPPQGSVKSRIKMVSLLASVLKWVWSLGVELKLKPSPEDLVDGREAPILCLIYVIMLKFIQIDPNPSPSGCVLNPKDALLLWVRTQCMELAPIENFKKSLKSPFHNGMVFCCLIYKNRPQLMPEYSSLVPADALSNIALAQEAAHKYFQLEKFLTPLEITKLDENSMFVYCSEFYFGISQAGKD
eukprot:TRINITY_DN642_c0_g1_i3.p1 TRINITY_DN642_c0_g1~~TRINITY_DN642_c0_g1_i3.p1  ORF type:complete len:245 (+),score=40.65 TRINITY_DN642_c0_g1_i3:111-845(+)